jgi:hypothetical protein
MFTRCDLDQTALRHRLLQAMDYYYGTAITGDLSLQNRWRTRFDLVGKHVAIQTRYGAQSGRLLDLRFDVVSWQVSGGAVGTCPPEDIEHITISDLS